MTHQIDTIKLTHGRPGTQRHIIRHQFGTMGARPKIHIQAGLHAGELPGMVVADHLVRLLAALDAAGRVAGHIVLIPAANPIGLDQGLLGTHIGRFEMGGGGNFNRAFADLAGPVAERLRNGHIGPLGPDADANRRLVQDALAAAADRLTPTSEADSLRRLLLANAIDADAVLDLHCDSEALMHLYATPDAWDAGVGDLAVRLDCRAAFLATESGGSPFDEACSTPWDRLRAEFVTDTTPLPVGCAATTVELRGEGDVDDGLAAADAAAIIDHLIWRGAIHGTAPDAPWPDDVALPLAGVDRVRAPAGGIVLYHVALGDRVAAGQVVATILDPMGGQRHACTASTDGLVWAHRRDRYAFAGDILLSVAGREVLVTEGPLLTA